jgi:hypothetical protein
MSDLSELLQALDARWWDLGMPVDEILAPGLSETEVRSTLSAVTERPCDEIVEWFTWHNGRLDPRPNLVLAAPSGFALLSVIGALAERSGSQAVAIEAAAMEPEAGLTPAEHWPSSWLPIGENGSGGLLVAEIGTDPIHAPLRFHDWGGESPAGVPSLVAAVQLWLTVLDTGVYAWADGMWHYDYLALPVDYKRMGLVG